MHLLCMIIQICKFQKYTRTKCRPFFPNWQWQVDERKNLWKIVARPWPCSQISQSEVRKGLAQLDNRTNITSVQTLLFLHWVAFKTSITTLQFYIIVCQVLQQSLKQKIRKFDKNLQPHWIPNHPDPEFEPKIFYLLLHFPSHAFQWDLQWSEFRWRLSDSLDHLDGTYYCSLCICITCFYSLFVFSCL